MARSMTLSAWMPRFGLLMAWLAGAQTQTVFLTQTQTVYTSCDCPAAILSPLSPLLSLATATVVSSTFTPGIIDGSTPGVISVATPGVAGSISTGTTAQAGATSTLTGSFPSMGGFSTTRNTAASTTEPTPIPSSTPRSKTESLPTDASIITLSSGLGPLLSSSSSSASSSPSALPSSKTAGSVASTTIKVLSGTFAPTATFSDLTTLGIPESLSVDLSLVSSVSALHSSAALISFGTASPAVLSTVLPAGVSMGTSSQTLTSYSTIVLGSASLTGVTLLAPRSPTSCFTLPTPATSLDMVAVAVVPQNDFDLNNPLIFAFGNNGTIPQYVSALASGNPYVLDLSPENPVKGQLGLQIPGDDALVFDGSGMSLYTGNCSALTQVLVDNFYSQLGVMAGRSSRSVVAPQVGKRQPTSSSSFAVEVAVDAYLSTASSSPNLTFGDNECPLQLKNMGSKTNSFSWSCMYPPATGGAASCESSLNLWLSDMTTPSTTPENTTAVLATLSPFLALAGDSILDLFPGSDPALSLGFTFMQQAEKAAKQAVIHVGPAACQVLHAFDSDDLVMEDSGPLGTQTIGSYMTAPPPSISINLAASATAVIVQLPRRKVNPKDSFLKQIATDFKSILGAFTHWLGGLGSHKTLGVPGLGSIGRFQETVSLPLSHPIITTTSDPTLSTPSTTHVLPTVTVTHVLGDGWFSPSTYVVGPGANTVPQLPANALSWTATNSTTSIDTSSISMEAYDFLTSSSSPTYVSSNVVEHVVAQLADMESGDASAVTGQHGSFSDERSSELGITTTGVSLGHDGYVVVVTTTLTFLNGGQVR